ncbi:YcjF family protein [Aestuariivirga sp.]|uniref:YcjF family protein n=1 Tax=Aestuariivirga sp. TaxID=2650926 RepID=UPI0039E289A3
MSDHSRSPKAFVIAEEEEAKPPTRRKPRAITDIEFPPEDSQGELLVLPPALPRRRRGWHWGALLAGSLASLAALWAGLSITQLIEQSFAHSETLGWLAAVAAGLAAFALAAIIVREIWSLARLARIEHIQDDAAKALNHDDPASATRAIANLSAVLGSRADSLWGLQSLKQHDGDVMDARDRIRLAERYLVTPRDEEAHRLIARTARRVTLITTVTPTAALDMLIVASQNLRMMREIATLYGGRPSTLSTFRLARMVLGHLAVTGGLALSDNLLQHVVGKGVLGRLSARFGEGAVNGIMTARIGIAARDVCRPFPQEPKARETLGSLLRELVSMDKGEPPQS